MTLVQCQGIFIDNDSPEARQVMWRDDITFHSATNFIVSLTLNFAGFAFLPAAVIILLMETDGKFGSAALARLAGFGEFCCFGGRTIGSCGGVLSRRRNWPEIVRQFFIIGTQSVPVILVTGLFVGAVLSVQAVPQLRMTGMIDSIGSVVNISVLRELGPILAGLMLAGRVGGGLTAELGTMHVTEQIDAVRAMGADPIKVLVVPRFLACVLLIPVVSLYASFMGIIGGYLVSVYLFGTDPTMFWDYSSASVGVYDLFYGPVKCLFFGAAIAIICCYKGFNCKAGAAGVGRACTESFVLSCMAVLGLDFLLGMTLNTAIELIWGMKSMF